MKTKPQDEAMQTIENSDPINADWMHFTPGYMDELRITQDIVPLPATKDDVFKKALVKKLKGGSGSGNFGHAGRPGKRGGSAPQSFDNLFAPHPKPAKPAGPEDLSNNKYNSRDFGDDFRVAEGVYRDHLKNWHEDYMAHFATLKFLTSQEGSSNRSLDNFLNGKIGWVDKNAGAYGSEKKYTNVSDAQRAQVKRANIDLIYKELDGEVSKDQINRIIKQWSRSANDHLMASLSLQEAASQEFGFQMSDWQKENLKAAKMNKEMAQSIQRNDTQPPQEWRDEQARMLAEKFHASPQHINWILSAESVGSNEYGSFDPLTDRATERKVVRAIYNATQKKLRASHISADLELTLYRGIDMKELHARPGERINYKGNALESWTADIHTAAGFGETVLAVRVPASRIFSTARSGIGCLSEGEILLMGMNDVIARVAYTHGV